MNITRRRGQVRDDFERFVAGSVDDLLRTAYLVTWDLPAAQDLVQECLLRLARRWPRVRSMDYPAAYARQIVVNLALDGARRRGRHRVELDGSGRVTVEDRFDPSAALALGTVEARSELVEGLRAWLPASGRCWCSATCMTSPKHRSRTSSAARWGRSRTPLFTPWSGCARTWPDKKRLREKGT